MIDDLKPGVLFRKTYCIVRKLGEGSTGSVYLADHVFLDEYCALKILPPEVGRNEALIARFRRDLNALRQVRNKNIVNSGDLQRAEDETPFIVMEYVDGPDLRFLLEIAPGPFDVDLAFAITRSITEGLAAAHASGLVHRDLKPKNILIAREGNSSVPKIAGFAVVAIKEHSASLRSAVQTALTPTYAAPEQWYGTEPAELDGRTDLYALGGILYEMLTGQTAFNAADYEGWAMQHLKAQPLPPSSLRPDLAQWQGLDQLVLSLLAKDREGRPRSATELLQFLNAVQFGIPIPQPAPANVVEKEVQSTPIPEATLPLATPAAASPVAASPVTTSPVTTSPEAPSPVADPPIPPIIPPVFPDTSVDLKAETNLEPTTDTNAEISAPIAEEPVSISEQPTTLAAVEAIATADEEFAPVVTPAVIPAPVFPAPAPEEERLIVPEPPRILRPQVAAETAGKEPTGILEPAVSASADKTIPTDEASEKPADFHDWLSQYERRSPTQAPGKPVKPQTAKEILDKLKPSIERTQEQPFQTPGFNASADRSTAAGQGTEPSTRPEIAVPGADRRAEISDERKELDELLRIFSSASGIGSTGAFPGGSARLGRRFGGSTQGKDKDTAARNPVVPESMAATAGGLKAPFAVVTGNAGEVQAPLPDANSVGQPDRLGKHATPDGTTTDRFTHPVWKALAALVLLSVVGFAGWRLTYTDPKAPPQNLSKGCTAGDAKVCTQLAAWYEQTNTVKDGDAKAVIYYAKACDARFPLACRKLGYKYLFGKGIPVDKPRALPLLKKGCDQGDYESCDVLAEIYHNGNDVTKDDAQATLLYSKSCSLGEEFGCTWAARLTALNSPATPPVHRPRPATTTASGSNSEVAPDPASATRPKPSPATAAQPAPPPQ